MKALLYLACIVLLLQACSLSKDDESSGETGQGGSLARFTILNDHLYIVNETTLQTYSLLSNQSTPVKVDEEYLGFGTETIFPYENKLLLGTQDGMYIFDVSTPGNPFKVTMFQHIRSCDPVVAENGFAYITLNDANQRCWRGLNEMQIVDIHDPNSPYLVKSYTMDSPKGLDIHNDTLFVCDNGLKIMDVSNKNNPSLLRHFTDIQAEDVIYTDGRLLVIGADGFHQYTISTAGISKISTIPVIP